MVSIITLLCVFVLIGVRQIGRFRFQIWQIMLLGAIVVLASGQITPLNALKSIDVDVMLFLFGMFIVGQALEESGYLSHLAYRLFGKTRSLDSLVLAIIFSVGLLSAFLMNDTIAIIGTPVMLRFAVKTGTRPKLLLLVLAFSVTIGSVMSPIGNPQNLLVAINSEIQNPFVTFLRYLAVPTLINLFLTYLIVRLFYRRDFAAKTPLNHASETITDTKLANLTRISLIIILVLVIIKISIVLLGYNIDFRLTYIALAAALPIILFSPRRFRILRKIDWFTLIFFASMFVLMASVWESGFFQKVLSDLHLDVASAGIIMIISVVLSQFISNVPMVALYLPVLSNLGATVRDMMALAAGSTIAGNLSILGAASNIIIIQNAEKKYKETLTFWDFVKIGVPLTIVNVLVYWLFFSIVSPS
ncbi:MAG: anion transporter [Dehalococcoidales bacterium]|nr:anion transporter [Dehalococcoidales bacterium]